MSELARLIQQAMEELNKDYEVLKNKHEVLALVENFAKTLDEIGFYGSQHTHLKYLTEHADMENRVNNEVLNNHLKAGVGLLLAETLTGLRESNLFNEKNMAIVLRDAMPLIPYGNDVMKESIRSELETWDRKRKLNLFSRR